MQKVVVFLDYANLNKSAQGLNVQIDYNHLLGEYLSSNKEGRFMQSAFAYVPIDPRSEHSLDADINMLWSAGFIVNSKVGIIAGSSYKCNFDVEIAMDIMRTALTLKPDIITIVSGDSDFIPLALELRRMGIYVEAAAFRDSMSKQLMQKVSGYINLDQYYLEYIGQRQNEIFKQMEIDENADITFSEENSSDDIAWKAEGNETMCESDSADKLNEGEKE